MGQGPAASIGLRCRVHSASSFYSWLQTTKLSLIYFPRHYTDIVQILFLPQTVPSWESVRNNQQVCRERSCLTPTWCSKVHAFVIPVILPSGSGLEVCNKAIILRKTWKMVFIIVDKSSTQFLDIWCAPRCYFYEISQDCESTWLEIPTTSPPFCFCWSRYANRATSFFINSQMVSLMHLRTRHKTVKNRHSDIMVPSNPPPKVLIHIMGLS